jgi:hypothetical protein
MISAGDFETKNGIISGKFIELTNDEVSEEPRIYSDAIKQLRISNWPVDGLCIRKGVIQHLTGFREDMRCYEITEFILRCALVQPKIYVYPKPLYAVTKIAGSTSKIWAYRVEGLKSMGQSLLHLSDEYLDYSKHLRNLSKIALLNYIGSLILIGSKDKARKILLTGFPFKRNVKWLKFLLATVLPDWISRSVAGRRILKEYV